jgi:hypothetical protein
MSHILIATAAVILFNVVFAILLYANRRDDVPRRARLLRWVIHPNSKMRRTSFAQTGAH